ncbi:SER-THR-PHOSPHATASE domain-containing protein [Aphelenchoides besseyi]|nr:SER-THR-PHOSPHATASE domain-containing protein [Aphelenchoides besseyi]
MFNSIESLVGSENKSAPNHKVTGVQKTGDSVKQPENPSPFDFGSNLPIQQQFSTPNFFSSSMFYNPLALTQMTSTGQLPITPISTVTPIPQTTTSVSTVSRSQQPTTTSVATGQSEKFDGNVEIEKLIREIWNYVYSFSDGPPMKYEARIVIVMLRRAFELLKKEPTGKVIVVGDLHGQADSLISLLSTVEMPPHNVFLFLGNYAGQGFGPHEVLFFLLALKVRYPHHIYLLKGNLEDVDGNEFIEGLILRNLMNTSMVWFHLERILGVLPWAAVLNRSHFCVHGGIGPQLLKHGVRAIRKCRRPAVAPMEIAIEQEAQWSCFRLAGVDSQTGNFDGSPLFGEEELNQFLKANNLRSMIRSRQCVIDGVLNFPAAMFTVWSAAMYLDNFQNLGAIIIIDSDRHLAVINRIRVMEDEPKSLDDTKPAAGRNAIILPSNQ